MSTGRQETDKLRANIQDQVNRLLTQLQDLEELKEELDEDEYKQTKEETLQQMREFQTFLKKTIGGNMTLVSEFGSVQLVTSSSFLYKASNARFDRIEYFLLTPFPPIMMLGHPSCSEWSIPHPRSHQPVRQEAAWTASFSLGQSQGEKLLARILQLLSNTLYWIN